MRPRMLTAAAAGALTLSLLGPTGPAGADPRQDPGPALPEQASATAHERAEAALERAQALFDDRPHAEAGQPEGGREATMILNELVRARPDLTASEREQADALLARPTDKWGDTVNGGTFQYSQGEETPVCGTTTPICVHYASRPDRDAPPRTDADSNRIPDAVDDTLAIAEQVHTQYTEGGGYFRPESDGGTGGRRDDVDIYLANTGSAELYGYCTTDPGTSGRTRPAYCVVDDDFSAEQFPAHTPQENRQVTLAHEYFHAIQFAYDYFEDAWFMEATATWAEDELYDDVNDNRWYLTYGQLRQPGISLDRAAGLNVYGNWIFFRYLSERFPTEDGVLPRIVRTMWEQASERGVQSTAAIQRVLAALDTTFTGQYGNFAAANRRPAAHYEEGGGYGASPVVRRRLEPGDQRTVSTRLDHLTHRTFRFVPVLTRRLDWRLRLDVDMPRRATSPAARLLVYSTDGTVDESTVRLSRAGDRRVTVPFSSRRVAGVELVLVNASRRARDNDLRSVVAARTFRR